MRPADPNSVIGISLSTREFSTSKMIEYGDNIQSRVSVGDTYVRQNLCRGA